MEDSPLVAEEHALQDLVGVALDQRLGDHLVLADGGVHVLLQVHREELEDEVQAVLLHDHVLQEHNASQSNGFPNEMFVNT